MSDMFNKKINRRAIFSDETSSFRIPVQPRWRDRVLVRIRTFKDNIDKVEIVTDRLTRIIMEKEKVKDILIITKPSFLLMLKISDIIFVYIKMRKRFIILRLE